ncbi:MAG: GNAT family N-acetyltransferase [Paracoccaceae bacterium]
MYRATEATWPPLQAVPAGPWTLREGAGGGKRVSAATQHATLDADVDVPAAEDAMRIMGQEPLFMIREGDNDLDAALARRGYGVVDPVNLWLCPVAALTDRPVPPVMAFSIWEPLAIMREIWAEGDVGPERVQVMERARGPKTALLGRLNDKPAGVGYCALDDSVAMVHALHVRPDSRNAGLGGWMMRAAAHWAADWNATWMSVICTQSNASANWLYMSLGMELAGRYHYRVLRTDTPSDTIPDPTPDITQE